MAVAKKKKIYKRIIKWLLSIVIVLIALLILTWVFLQTPLGQRTAKNLAANWLSKKLHTKFSIASFRTKWFSQVNIKGIYLEDQQGSLLLSVGEIQVDYDLWKIIKGDIVVSHIYLDSVRINVHRNRTDSLFNFSFIPLAFAGEPDVQTVETAQKDSAAPIKLSLGTLSLSRIHLNMDDLYGGQVYRASIHSLKTKISQVDLDGMKFGTDYFLADGIQTSITMSPAYKTDSSISTGESIMPYISCDTLAITNTQFTMEDVATEMKVETNLGELSGKNIIAALNGMNVTASGLNLIDHTTSIKIKSSPPSATANTNTTTTTVDSTKPFTWTAGQLTILRNNFFFDDDAFPASPPHEMNFSHLGLKDINVVADSIVYDGLNYSALIKKLSVHEKSGFQLKHFATRISYGETGAEIKDLVLQTAQNKVQGHLKLSYESLAAITTRPQHTLVNATLRETTLQLDELLYFQPTLKNNSSFKPLLGKKFFLNTVVTGQLDKLRIPTLSVRESGIKLLASADVYHLPDIKRLRIDLILKNFEGSRDDLLALLPEGMIPDSLLHYIPAQFRIAGRYKGTMDDMNADLQIQSSDGDVSISGTMKNITDKNKAVYDLNLAVKEIQLDKLLDDTTMGLVSATVKVNGQGWDLPTAKAEYDATVTSARYNGYTYHDINLQGSLLSNKLKASLRSEDPNIHIISDTEYDMNSKSTSFKTNTEIYNIDLNKLRFLDDTIIISGRIDADVPQFDSTQLRGDMLLSNLKLLYGGKNYFLDSVLVTAEFESDTQSIKFKSPFGEATMTGRYTVGGLSPAARTIANRYLYTSSPDTNYTEKVQATLRGHVHLPDSIAAIVPGLKSVSPFDIAATINTDSSRLAFRMIIPKIKYDTYTIDSFIVLGSNVTNELYYNNLRYLVGVRRLNSPSFNLERTAASGNIKHGIIQVAAGFYDQKMKPRYLFPFSITNDPARPYLQVNDSLIVNGKDWSVSKNNIVYLSEQMKGSHLKIYKGDESITLVADTSSASGLPFLLRLDKFQLKNISQIVITDTTLVEGSATGFARIDSLNPFSFVSDITIDSLRLKEVSAGTLAISVKQETAESLGIDVGLKGPKNDITIRGTYNTIASAVDLQLDMASFNTQLVHPFAANYLSKLVGVLNGQLTVKGTMDKPIVRGKLHVDSIETIYKDYATEIKILAGELDFNERGISFRNFEFTDSAGHKGTITGDVLTTDYTKYNMALRLRMNDFLVIGRRRSPDQKIFGPTSIDADMSISGGEKMVIKGTVKVQDSSAFTYIYVPEDASIRSDGLMEFFDPSQPIDSSQLKAIATLSGESGFEIDMSISITPSSSVTIMLDEMSGDHLTMKGNASLNFGMDPKGDISLTGHYIAETGEYDLSIAQIIRKKFTIEKGSIVTWTGDLLSARMDIKALYEVKTTAAELVTDVQSVPGIDKQKFNFDVYLLLTGELLKPDINFKIDMPEDEQSAFNGLVYARIRQVNNIPAELNKQVMGLLALNHFIADNPFSSLSESGAGSNAYMTAGNLLTQELTDMVGKFVKGVDIDFSLEKNENYTSGEAEESTDLKVGISKSIAQNRLSIYVGSSFALEGHNQNNNSLSGIAGDVTAEYMLTKDGRYRLKAYRINEDDLVYQGMIVKTGVTFVLALEFNRFKYMFGGKKSRRKNVNQQ